MLFPLPCLLIALAIPVQSDAEAPAPPKDTAQEKAAEPISDEAVAEAVQAAVEVLLHNQENYQADNRMRRTSDDDLPEWQKGELERLEKIRERAKKGRRKAANGPTKACIGCKRDSDSFPIPSGYRVGGSAIVCDALLRAPGFKKNSPRGRGGAAQRGVHAGTL